MFNNNSNGSRAARARGFMALCAMLAVGLGLMTRPAEAAPFAYVTNGGGVSVIDTATTPPSVVATIPVPLFGFCCDYLTGGVAVTPDGKHVFVTGDYVSVIDTTTSMVVASVRLGDHAFGVAVTPDGKYAYVPVPSYPADVVVIATPPNTGGDYISFPSLLPKGLWGPRAVAITPDGQHAYLPNPYNPYSNEVFVIDTATNTVEAATIPVGSPPYGVAVTPDGKHAYVTNEGSNSVSVIDTATNTVEAATIPVGTFPQGVAITPDGKHAYVANFRSNNLSVIATASNTVVATIPVGTFPRGVACQRRRQNVPNGGVKVYQSS